MKNEIKEFIKKQWQGVFVGLAIAYFSMIIITVIESTILKIAIIIAK